MKSPNWIFKDNILRLIAVCIWNLHRAVFLMDHADILLSNEEAEEIIGWNHVRWLAQKTKFQNV